MSEEITTTTSFGFRAYFKPTPQLFRRIGTGFLSVFSMAGLFTQAVDANKNLVYLLLAIGILGKFFTTFFGDDQEPLAPTEEITAIVATKTVEKKVAAGDGESK